MRVPRYFYTTAAPGFVKIIVCTERTFFGPKSSSGAATRVRVLGARRLCPRQVVEQQSGKRTRPEVRGMGKVPWQLADSGMTFANRVPYWGAAG